MDRNQRSHGLQSDDDREQVWSASSRALDEALLNQRRPDFVRDVEDAGEVRGSGLIGVASLGQGPEGGRQLVGTEGRRLQSEAPPRWNRITEGG